MPSRLLRETILDSEAVNKLSVHAEVFYRRLMSVVDDFGRFDGRAQVLRSRLYPLRIDTVREADIARWIAECEKAGLIALYAVDRKPYILFRKLGSPRAKESKFPPPPDGTENASTHPFTDENGCKRTQTDAPYSGSGSGASSDSKESASQSGGVPPAAAGEPPPPADPPPKKRTRKPSTEPHPQAIAAWFEQWQAKYGERYPFAGERDGKAIKTMLADCRGDVAKLVAVFARYLADDEPFFANDRHSLGLLRAKFPRFLVEGTSATNPARGGMGRPGRADARPGKYDDLDAPGPQVTRGSPGPDLFGPARDPAGSGGGVPGGSDDLP